MILERWLGMGCVVGLLACQEAATATMDAPLADAPIEADAHPDSRPGVDGPAADAHPAADARVVDARPGADAPEPVADAAVPADAATLLGDAGPSSTRETARPLGTTDAANGFYEYLPPGYGDATARPLMVFWHGVGEDGNGTTDLAKVLANGPPKLIHANQWPADRPFVVLSPQHAGGGCPGTAEIHDFIAFAMAHYTVDAKRIYLTGLSCGAIGSWGYIGTYTNQVIAAAVLVSGDPGDPDQVYSVWGQNMCGLGVLPIWSFHGDMDTTVLPGDDETTMMRLIACPAPPRQDAQFTLYAGVGHDAWTRTYDLSAGHDIYAWLLAQKKP